MIYINYNEEDRTVWISSEDSSGVEFQNISIYADLVEAFREYLEIYGPG